MLTVGSFRGLFLSLCLMVILARCLFTGAARVSAPYKVKRCYAEHFPPVSSHSQISCDSRLQLASKIGRQSQAAYLPLRHKIEKRRMMLLLVTSCSLMVPMISVSWLPVFIKIYADSSLDHCVRVHVVQAWWPHLHFIQTVYTFFFFFSFLHRQ